MTAPDKIWAWLPGCLTWSDIFSAMQRNPKPGVVGRDREVVEYIRRDPAVLAALPEVQALVDAAYERAAAIAEPRIKMWTECDGVNTDLDQAIAAIEGISSAIRAMKERKE